MMTTTKRNLTQEQVNAIIADFFDGSFVAGEERKLATGTLGAVALKFQISEQHAGQIWGRAKQNRAETGRYSATPQKKGKCGHKKNDFLFENLQEEVEKVPHERRGTIHDLATALGIPKSTLFDMMKEQKEGIVATTTALKPMLNDEQKLARMIYSAERLVEMKFENGNVHYEFDALYDEMHANEKWFFLFEENQRIYLSRREKEEGIGPKRKAKSKRFIPKVMFLCVVARPHFDSHGNCTFDGKIGIWPFVERTPAKRNSKNRCKGTLVTSSVNVTKEVYCQFIIDKVLPAAIEKWPRRDSPPGQLIHIGLQHDNPNTHFDKDDKKWLEAANQYERIRFHLREQPANLPNTNINDLGFFRLLQSNYYKLKKGSNIDDLINNVTKAFNEYDPRKLERIWLTHQSCLDAILNDLGGNNYEIPHIGKDTLEKQNLGKTK